MYFKDKKKNAKMEKSAQRILDLLFDETDHDGNFSAIKFGAKSNNGNCHELPYSSYEPVILEKD
jgi:hypothetical protein